MCQHTVWPLRRVFFCPTYLETVQSPKLLHLTPVFIWVTWINLWTARPHPFWWPRIRWQFSQTLTHSQDSGVVFFHGLTLKVWECLKYSHYKFRSWCNFLQADWQAFSFIKICTDAGKQPFARGNMNIKNCDLNYPLYLFHCLLSMLSMKTRETKSPTITGCSSFLVYFTLLTHFVSSFPSPPTKYLFDHLERDNNIWNLSIFFLVWILTYS